MHQNWCLMPHQSIKNDGLMLVLHHFWCKLCAKASKLMRHQNWYKCITVWSQMHQKCIKNASKTNHFLHNPWANASKNPLKFWCITMHQFQEMHQWASTASFLPLRHQIATASLMPEPHARHQSISSSEDDDFLSHSSEGWFWRRQLSLPALLWATQINRIAHVTADFWHNNNLWGTRRRNSPSFRPSFASLSVTASSFSCWRSPWAFSAAHQNWCIDAYLMHAITFDALQKWCNNASNVHQNGLIFDAVAFGRVVDFLKNTLLLRWKTLAFNYEWQNYTRITASYC